MNVIRVPWISGTMNQEVFRAVEMSHWCKAQGLKQHVDYDWFFHSAFKETEFRFYGEDGLATMFSLRWIR